MTTVVDPNDIASDITNDPCPEQALPRQPEKEFSINDANDNDDNGEHEHDQLPNVEEYKTEQQHNGNNHRRMKLYMIGVVSLMCIIIISVILGITIHHSNQNDPSDDDAMTYPSRFESVRQYIINENWISNVTVAYDTTSPQYQAMVWIADVDPLHVPLEVENPEFRERYVMAVFYYALNGDAWYYPAAFLSAEPTCDWKYNFPNSITGNDGVMVQVGVLCTTSASLSGQPVKQITQLFIPSNHLQGTLPEEIGLLESLSEINLFNNNITGSLPSSLQELRQFNSLIMHNNDLSGEFPQWFPENHHLSIINLAFNNMQGYLPDNIQDNAALTTLKINSNFLQGNLSSLSGMENLVELHLDDNLFTGSLTDDLLVSWKNLEILDLGSNNFIGPLPEELFASSSLRVIDLHNNHFNGEIPRLVQFGERIEFLAFHQNLLSGPIDDRIAILSTQSLHHFDVSDNYFTGIISTEIGRFTSLKYLFLANNINFTAAPIPTEIGLLTQLQDLSFQNTNRMGPIPTEIGNCQNLILLDLNRNELDGEIPTEIGQLKKLQYLTIQENPNITGMIPTTITNIRNLNTFILYQTGITSGTEAICDNSTTELTSTIQEFVADCSVVPCDCCTNCCENVTSSGINVCSGLKWLSRLDPIDNYEYTRQGYSFHETNDIDFAQKQQYQQHAALPSYGAPPDHGNNNKINFYNQFGMASANQHPWNKNNNN